MSTKKESKAANGSSKSESTSKATATAKNGVEHKGEKQEVKKAPTTAELNQQSAARKEKVRDEIGVPQGSRRRENLHEQNPDLHAAIDSSKALEPHHKQLAKETEGTKTGESAKAVPSPQMQ